MLLALILTCFILSGGCKKAPVAYTPKEPEVIVMNPIERVISDYTYFTGTTRGFEQAEVRPRVSGFVQEISFRADTQVRAKQCLFVIDPRPFEAKLQQTEANAMAKQATLTKTESNLARTQDMIKNRVASEQELVDRRADYDLAGAELAEAQAEVRSAKLDLEFTRVVAPIDGRISRNLVDRGTLVNADQTVLATIVNDSKVYVYFNVADREMLDYLRIHPMMRTEAAFDQPPTLVFLQLPGDSGYPRQGQIESGANSVDVLSGTYQVRAVFNNPQRLIVPGLFVRIRVYQGELKVTLVPDVAVGSDQRGKYVLVVTGEGIVQRRSVEVGEAEGAYRRVISGLKTADRVIVNGIQRARPGGKVVPVDEKNPPPLLPTTAPTTQGLEDLTPPLERPATAPATQPATLPAGKVP